MQQNTEEQTVGKDHLADAVGKLQNIVGKREPGDRPRGVTILDDEAQAILQAITPSGVREASVADVQQAAAVYIRDVLGVPEELSYAALKNTFSPLAPAAKTLRRMVMKRERRFGRLAMQTTQIMGDLNTILSMAVNRRIPNVSVSGEAFLNLVRLQVRITELDDTLAELAADLIEGGVAAGLIMPTTRDPHVATPAEIMAMRTALNAAGVNTSGMSASAIRVAYTEARLNTPQS